MKFIVDRFEGEFAVVELENGEMVDILKVLLPIDTKEGDIINTTIDLEETQQGKDRIQNKFNKLFNDK